LEPEIENALDPGRFVPDRGCFGFVAGLEQVAATIGQLVTGEPARAATLYETFLAGCYEKAEQVDDSSGSFGMFAQTLICGWITARQAARACPQQTAAHLLTWMDTDQYGFCHQLERQAAPALDEAGLAALTDQIQARFEAAEQATAASDGSDRANQYSRHRWAEALRTLHATRNDLDAYVELAQQTGLTTDDCLTLANLLATQGDPAQALSWVDLLERWPFRATMLTADFLRAVGVGLLAIVVGLDLANIPLRAAWRSTPNARTGPSPGTASPSSSPDSWPTWDAASKRWRRPGPTTASTPASTPTTT
jgi:Family of unknown function (DUF6880)